MAPKPVEPEAPQLADLIERFIDDVRPAKPDLCREVLEVALQRSYPSAWDDAVGFWSFFTAAATDVYVHVDTPGSATGHTYGLLERWFRWLGDIGEIPAFDVALWLFELERARRSHSGMKPRYMCLPDDDELTGVQLGVSFSAHRGPPGIDAFLADLDDQQRHVADFAVRNMVCWLAERRGVPVRFDDFDADDYFGMLLDTEDSPSAVDAQILHHIANYLESRAPQAVVAKTRELALSLALAA